MSLRYNDKNGVETLLSGLTQGDNTAIPDGGDTNQVLAKNSTTDRDLKWATTETLIKKGQNNGVASLGADGKVPLGQIPEIPETNNLIPYPYTHLNNRTSNGIAYTVNKDGSVTAKGTIGTTTTNSGFNFCTRPPSIGPGPILEKGKTYTLTGCPVGGSNSTYRMQLVYNTSVDGSTYNAVYDYGDGVTFTVADTYVGQPITVQVYLFVSGNTYDVTFYPMLVEGEEAQPYVSPIDESDTIVKRMYEVEEQAAINLLPFPYDSPLVYSSNGITWVVNDDGSITANGTATADSNYACELLTAPGFKIEDIGYYTVSGCPEDGWTDTYLVWIAELPDSGTGSIVLGRDYGKGVSFYIAEANLNRLKQVVCTVKKGQTVTNLTFKPMLTKGTLPIEYKPTTEDTENRLNFVENNSTKNLIPFPYDAFDTGTKANRGVTYTVNKDGSITSVGTVTNTSGSYANIIATDRTRMFLPSGSYTLSAHSESARTGFLLYFWDVNDTTQKYSGARQGIITDSSNTYIVTSEDGTLTDLGTKGINHTKHFTLGSDAYVTCAVRTIRSTDLDATVDETLYFMLEKGFIEHDYVPTVSEAEYDNYYNKLNITGGTLTGDLWISPAKTGWLNCGENKVNGYGGAIALWGKDATDSSTNANRAAIISPGTKLTANRTFTFPNASGEIMTTAGGTFTGAITSTSSITIAPTASDGSIFLGQSAANGQVGAVHIYGKDASNTSKGNWRVILKAGTKLTADRTFTFPNGSGEILTTLGGTITGGNFEISRSSANSIVTIGQSSVNGYTGHLRIYGKDATSNTNANRYAEIRTNGQLTANRAFWFPDYGGEIEVRQVNNAAIKLTTNDVTRKTFTFTDSKITSQNCYYYKIDHRVVVYVSIEASAALTTNLTYTIPAGYRPLNKKYAVDIHTLQTSTSHPVLTVGTDGVVTVLPVNQTSINITVEYDAWQ